MPARDTDLLPLGPIGLCDFAPLREPSEVLEEVRAKAQRRKDRNCDLWPGGGTNDELELARRLRRIDKDGFRLALSPGPE